MAAARVSIPAAVRRTIQNIKEIAGGHTDEEVYAALRECDMDPNETAQKLLLQDTFHEVKRKRDKKKESNKESADPRWRHGTQGRGGKSGRGNYSSRQLGNSSDLTARNALARKENEVNSSMDKCSSSSPVNLHTDTKIPTSILSLSGGLSSGPSQPVVPMEKNSLAICHLPSSDSKGSADLEGTPEIVVDLGPDVSQSSIQPPPSIPGVCTSVSESVPTPSIEAHSLGATKNAFRGQRAADEYKVAADNVSVPKDTSQPSGSSIALPSGSRPSSSYSSRSQPLSGSQKVVPNKEWKPKSMSKPTQAENITRDDVPVTVEVVPQSVPVSTAKEDTYSKVDKRLGDMQLFDKQHVIIPNHLQVIESEKYGLSFGSFGTSFEQTVGFPNEHESEKSSTLPEDEASQGVDEVVVEPASSHQLASSTVEAAAEQGLQQLKAEMTDNISPQEVDNSSSTPEVAESDQPKDTGASHIPQDAVQNTPSYSTIALAPQSQGNQVPLLETSEYQVQQPNDFSTDYYTQLYRPIADVDGHLSPFTAPGAAIKSGNMSVLPTQTGQTQEELNSLVLSSSGPSPLATPAPGVVPSSIAIPQPLPVFRQPVGVHLPHYQPSFIPYNQYISPFFVPPHPLHHFMGNPAFPQSLSPGSMYPPVSSAVAPPVKYSATTYKPGANTGSQTYAVTPGAYGTYGSSPSVYTNNHMVVSGTSAENGDVNGSQFKENNIYIAGQQSEGSTVWIPAPGRDLSALQSSSFYGLPQGQHMAYAPAQAGHGAFGGMYHPAQTLAGAAVHPLLQPSQTIAGAVEMVGPPANGYQQPQHAQMNWGNY